MKRDLSSISKLLSTRVLTAREIGVDLVAFLVVFLLLYSILRFVRLYAFLNIPEFWPMSIFEPAELTSVRLARLLLPLALFVLTMLGLRHVKKNLWILAATAFLLIIGTNFVQGPKAGFVTPLSYAATQYYTDALAIGNPAAFVSHYERLQPALHAHAQTHPPGSVLLFYLLHRWLGGMAIISIAVAAIATFLSAFFLKRLLSLFSNSSDPAKNYLCFLFLLIPAVQIYFCASLDAIIASLFLGVLYFSFRPFSFAGVLGVSIFLFLASSVTFAVPFLLCVIAVCALWNRRLPMNAIIAVLVCAVAWWVVFKLLGFNYMHSFVVASRIENPSGFRLFANPANYFLTRIECGAEILLFLGPWLIALCVRGLRLGLSGSESMGNRVAIAGFGVLALMFMVGAFHTGETARVCLFIYPLFMLPIARYLHGIEPTNREHVQLASLVFFQSLLMQYVGFYVW